jgi:hypothetical protein
MYKPILSKIWILMHRYDVSFHNLENKLELESFLIGM